MKIDASRTVWLAVLALCLVQFVDVLGVTVVVTALPAMLAGLRAPANAASRTVAGATLLAVAILLAGLSVVLDRRSAAPLLPGRLLRERPLREGTAGGLLNTAATSSAITLVTLYLQDARGYRPLTAGLMLLPFSLAVVGGSALAAPALARWRPQRVIAAGLGLIATADALLIPAAARPDQAGRFPPSPGAWPPRSVRPARSSSPA